MEIGEIAASATGDQDLFADTRRTVDDRHPAASLARFNGAHQASRPPAEHHRIKSLDHA
jgi:hypothetical protein